MLVAVACTPPAVIKRVDAAFPEGVYPGRKGTTLDAGVRVTLAADGTVTGARIVKTTGIPSFDAKAVSTAEQWQYAAPAPGCGDDPAEVVHIPFAHVALLPSGYDPCSHDALVLNQAVPEYPDAARSLSPGQRIVKLLVNLDGNAQIQSIDVSKSSGSDALDRVSITAARLSLYAPKFVDCKPVPGQYRLTVTFDPN
jgi:TonB family protein